MPLPIGTRIGPYEITGVLGAGGMGEVYRAHDARLARDVALKVLPDVFAADPERLARFQREAQVLAALKHPNIGAIYGLEGNALVLELIEGETLADRIARDPIPIDEALPIAKQIAEALQAAHEQGIIHRDLKPSNIKVQPDGSVKVLDFGLAKLTETPGTQESSRAGEAPLAHLSMSPTLTSPMATGVGVMLGTAAYMAPEQAKGRPADKRSDVWAFGCVLFEMLSRKRAFDAEDVSDTLALVLKGEPDWTTLPRNTPAPVRALLRSCLVKDRRHRVGDVAAALFVLEHDELETTGDRSSETARVSPWRRALAVVAAVIVVAVGAAYATWLLKPEAAHQITRFTIALPDDQQFSNTGRQLLAFSPDGAQLAYVANYRLYLRSMSNGETAPISGTEVPRGILNPVFSPDSQSIAFFSAADDTLKLINARGGTAVTLAAVASPLGASWGRDGILVGQGKDGIIRVPAAGGKPETIAKVAPNELAHGPQMLPDGDGLLFTLATSGSSDQWEKARIVVQSLSSQERKTIIEGASDARYLPTGHLVYAVGGTVFAVPFDPRRREVSGTAVPMIDGVRRSIINTGTAHLATSNTGSLAYIPGPSGISRGVPALVLVDQSAAQKVQNLSVPPAEYFHPRASPDGKYLAVATDDGRQAIIWVYDFTGASSMRRLTFGGRNRFPVWSPDGRRVAFQSDREGDLAIFSQPADGSGPPERLTSAAKDIEQIPESWSPDGRSLLFSVSDRSGFSLWILSVTNRKISRFADVRSIEPIGATFSPDGRWVAYASSDGTASPNRGVYIQPFPPTGARYQAPKTTGSRDYHPVWANGGHELLYIPSSGLLERAGVTTQPSFSFGAPMTIRLPIGSVGMLSSAIRNYDVLPDGRLVGVSGAAGDSNDIRIVLNWFEELTERVR